MANTKAIQLIERLHRKTQDDSLDWEEGPMDETYQVNFPQYSIIIEEINDIEKLADYQISILNSEGKTIEIISDEDLPKIQEKNPTRILSEIFNHARRKALGSDEALDYILGALGS
jgi:hypothetical protein